MKKLEKRIFYLEEEKKELKRNEKRYNRLKNWGLAAITLGFLSLSAPIYEMYHGPIELEVLKKYNKIEQRCNRKINANPTEGNAMGEIVYQMFGLGMLTIGVIPFGRGLDGKKHYRNELKKISDFYSYIPRGWKWKTN